MPRATTGRGTLAMLALVLLVAQPSGSAGARGGGAGEASRGAGLGATRQGLARGRSNAGRLLSDAEQAERLQGLAEVEQDLESTEQTEDSDLKKLERQIASMVQKRDVLRRSEARRKREISFLHAEVARLQGQSQASGGSTSSAAAGAQLGLKGAAAAFANQTLDQAIDLSDASLADAAVAGATDASTLGSLSADTTLASSGTSTESAEHSAGQAVAKEAVLKQQQEEQVRKAKQAAAAAAEAQRLAAEEKQRRVEEQRRAEEQKAATQRAAVEEAKRKRDAMADSADDSFKQFMKEEDGEDQMGDSDYEDSANALAGAIGWNRKEIENKADSAVKQLTEAIGGKKVVQSLQGMMAGIR